ncbi:MAG: DUF1446 domain-containing protein [Microthrixaceae bacterium]|nr:DUF1446 domain-containing protein [Microthrixaceae bacterium]
MLSTPTLRIRDAAHRERIRVLRRPGLGVERDAHRRALDVITGDYLAELTMLILARQRLRNPRRRVRAQLPDPHGGSLATAIDSGVKVVVNAGGLNPAGLAAALASWPPRRGSTPPWRMWRVTT